jgi:hypothetical protein
MGRDADRCGAVQHPVWDESFDVWQALPNGGCLEVQLWNSDTGRPDDAIAIATVNVADVLPKISAAIWLERAQWPGGMTAAHAIDLSDMLGPKGRASVQSGTPPRSRLLLQLTWVPRGEAAPWGEGRSGAPSVPWRATALCAAGAGEWRCCSNCAMGAGRSGATPRAAALV